jgi:hypothetical protein
MTTKGNGKRKKSKRQKQIPPLRCGMTNKKVLSGRGAKSA